MAGTLEARIARLEDIEAIRRLKGLYCECVDGGWDRATHDGDRFAELFTEDAVLEFVVDPALGEATRCEGRAAIRRLINASSAATYAAHNMCGELIEIDGDGARATWHAMNYITWPGYTYVATFIYYEDYVRVDGAWRISKIRSLNRGIHPLAEGTTLVRPGARAKRPQAASG